MLISLFICLKFRISYSLTYLRIVACSPLVCFGTFIVCCTLFFSLLFVLSSRAQFILVLYSLYRLLRFSLSFSVCLSLSYYVGVCFSSFIQFFLLTSSWSLHCSRWCVRTRWKPHTNTHLQLLSQLNQAMILLFSLTFFFWSALYWWLTFLFEIPSKEIWNECPYKLS